MIWAWSFVLSHVVCAVLCWGFLPPTDGVGCFYIDYFVFIDSLLCIFKLCVLYCVGFFFHQQMALVVFTLIISFLLILFFVFLILYIWYQDFLTYFKRLYFIIV